MTGCVNFFFNTQVQNSNFPQIAHTNIINRLVSFQMCLVSLYHPQLFAAIVFPPSAAVLLPSLGAGAPPALARGGARAPARH
jgi:hypothetical protein